MAQLQSTGITGSLTVTGNITAQEFHTEYVSSSILHESGSTSFGNTSDDVHNFTGSLNVLGPISAVGAGISDFERVHINNLQAWSAQDLGSASSGSIAFRINGRSGATNDFIVHSNGSTNYTMQVVGNAETHGQLHINPFGGNIGIGTTSPTKTLDVDGTGIFRNTLTVHRAAGDKKLQFIDDRTDTDTYSIEHDTSQIYFYNETEAEVVLAMKNSGDVYIPSGFLGIGTTTPSAPLQVHGEVYSQIKMYSDHTYSLNRNWRLMTNNFGSGNWGGFSIDQSSAQGGSTFTQRFGIALNGNVGIGTDNPGQKLHIHNTATLTATYQKFTNGTATTGTTLGIDADGDFLINNGETKQIKLYTSDAQRLTILSGGNVGIGNDNPVNAKLVVESGNSDGDNTVKIVHTRNDSNVPTRALQIDMDLSGTDNTDADRIHYGLHLDLNSTADGDISNEHRIYGVAADVRYSGFSDIVRGAWFHAESNNITENTAQLVGAYAEGVHDAGATAGGVTNMYGMYGLSSVQDKGTVGTSYGGFFNTNILSTRTVDTGVTKGVQGEVTIDADTANLSYGEMIAVMAVIDNNEGAVPDFGDQFLFRGDYQGTKGPDAWGLYVEGDKHYLGSRLFLGTTTADADSIMQVMGTDAERYVRFKTSNDESRFDFYIGGTGNASRLDMYTADGTTKNVQISSGGTSYFNGGNVGLGTTAPAGKLEISQQLSAAATIDYPVVITSRDDGNSINQVGGEGVGIKFRIAGNEATTPGDSMVGASIAAIREEGGDTDSSTGLGFFISQNNETLDEAIRIDHNGSVGIGVTPFTHGLGTSVNLDLLGNGGIWGYAGATYVNSNAYYDSGWKYKSTNPAAVLQVGGSSQNLSFRQAASGTAGDPITFTQPFMINSSGYVGISTTNPAGSLHVFSGTSERLLVGGDVSIKGATDLQIDGTSRRVSFNAGTGTVRTSTANSLYLATNSTTALTINSNQDATFAQDLTVNGNFTFNGGNVQGNVAYTVDMGDTSTFAENTFYPVTIPVSVGRETELRIEVPLNSGDSPSYATHSSGVSLYIKWSTTGNGWGTTYEHRTLYEWRERYTSATLVGGITQMTNGSIEVIYLRGGTKYYFYANRAGLTITPRSSTYTNNSQSVSPTTSVVNDPRDAARGNFAAQSMRASSLISGVVGVGTTSPAYPIHGFKTNTTSRTTTTDILALGSSHASVGYNGFGTAIVDYRRTYQESNPHVINRIKFIERGDSGNDWGGAIQFQTKALSSGTTGPVTHMSIEYNGNVGIGTTSPNDILHVSKAGAATRLRVGNNGAHDASIYFNTSTDWSIGTDTSNSNALTFGNSSAIGTATKMVIQTGGNVGIGTTSPTTGKLVVEGDPYVITNSGKALGGIDLRTNAAVATGVYGAAISFGTNGSGRAAISSVQGSSDADRQGLVFFTHGSGTGSADSAEAMRISHDGKVGISSQSPGALLDVSDRVYIDTYSSEASGNNAVISGFLRIRAGAKTGWGADDQLGKIEFYGADTSGAGARTAASIIAVCETGNGTSTTTFGSGLAFYTSPYNATQEERIRITDGGDVGIGTTSPRVKLHVKGENMTVGTIGTPKNDWYTTAYNSIQVGDGTTLWGRAGDSHFSGNYYVKDNSGAAQDTYINALSANDLWLDNGSGSLKYRNASLGGAGNAISWNTRFTVLANGNFGIGTTSASAKLHIHTDDDDAYAVRIEGSTNNGAGVWTGIGIGGETNNTKSAILFEDAGLSYSRGKLHLCVNNAADQTNATTADAKLTVSNDGNIGIGTTSPATSAKLTVMGNQTFGLPGNGANSSARFISIEGNADASGEGSSRIFFTEHNSTTAAMDNYGMSLGYRGGATSIVGASGNTWTGLSQIGNGQWGMWGHNNSADGNLVMYGDRAGTFVVVDGTLRSTGDVVAYYSSDKNLKDNLVKINDPLLKINKLSGYSFNWNDKQDTYEVGSRDIGIVAQEVEEVLPEIVQTRKNGHKAVKYEKLVALLIEGIKEQQETIDKLEDRIKKLESK